MSGCRSFSIFFFILKISLPTPIDKFWSKSTDMIESVKHNLINKFRAKIWNKFTKFRKYQHENYSFSYLTTKLRRYLKIFIKRLNYQLLLRQSNENRDLIGVFLGGCVTTKKKKGNTNPSFWLPWKHWPYEIESSIQFFYQTRPEQT